MIISYLGHSCFKIQDKLGVDGKTITTDPFDNSIGLKVPNFESNIVTTSNSNVNHSNVKALRGNPFIVDLPGEYEVGGIMVQGIAINKINKEEKKEENIVFRIEVDGITIVHLGNLKRVLTEKELEELDGVDILLTPIGGGDDFNAKKAIEVISQIEPRIVIPMHYKTKGSKADINDESLFLKEFEIKPTIEDKLKINKKDLPQEGMELIILNTIS